MDYPYVESPEYRGAPQPPFNPKAINESRFDDDMRFKEYEWKEEDGDIVLYWTSQGRVVKEAFIEEVKRCLSEYPSFKGKSVTVKMKTRGDSFWYFKSKIDL